jgi:polyphosphate kinase 2 (PPK2 family)
VTIVKLFLHISRAEQLKRLKARLDDPARNWKFTEADVAERRFWKAYQAAYADALRRCATETAPWYVVPADRKWYRNWAVARILLETLRAMHPRPPPPPQNLRALRRKLLASA